MRLSGVSQMARTNFENLAVFQLAERLSDQMWGIVIEWPILARDTVGKQLVRAADSIGANIAEGAGRGSYPDNRRFVRIARGSLHETKYWLRRAFRRSLLSEQQIASLKPLLDELGPRLNAYPSQSASSRRNYRAPEGLVLPTACNGQRTTDNGPPLILTERRVRQCDFGNSREAGEFVAEEVHAVVDA